MTTGLTGAVTWGTLSPGSVSVFFAAAAAWGLTLMVAPPARRLVGLLIVALSALAVFLARQSVAGGGDQVVSQAESASGVLGVFTIDDIAWSWSPTGIGFAFGAMVALGLSGAAGALWPGERRNGNRYQVATADPWEELSQGADPTAR
jgi:hypothetical protein